MLLSYPGMANINDALRFQWFWNSSWQNQVDNPDAQKSSRSLIISFYCSVLFASSDESVSREASAGNPVRRPPAPAACVRSVSPLKVFGQTSPRNLRGRRRPPADPPFFTFSICAHRKKGPGPACTFSGFPQQPTKHARWFEALNRSNLRVCVTDQGVFLPFTR